MLWYRVRRGGTTNFKEGVNAFEIGGGVNAVKTLNFKKGGGA